MNTETNPVKQIKQSRLAAWFKIFFGHAQITPVKFKHANSVRTAPKSNIQVRDLHVWCDGKQNISCWELNPAARWRILFTGKVWLGVMGFTLPPVYMEPNNPFRNLIYCPFDSNDSVTHSLTAITATPEGHGIYGCTCGCTFRWRNPKDVTVMVNPNEKV